MSALAQLDTTITEVAAKVAAMLAAPGSMAPHELAGVLSSLAAVRTAVRPAALSAFRITGVEGQSLYAYDAMAGSVVQILVVDGAVIPRTKWAWSSEHGSLLLVNYEFPENAVVELYYLN